MPARCLLLALAAALAAPAAQAQPATFGRGVTLAEIQREYAGLRPRPDTTAASPDPFLGITGLVVDETATPAGRLFYDAFFLVWQPPPALARATLTLAEQPLPGNSTAVLIRADGELVFQARLPRRSEEVTDLAAQAAQFLVQQFGR